MAAGNRPAEAALRANALRTTAAELAAGAAGREPPGGRPAGGARARRPLRRVRLAAVGAGRLHAAVARRDGGRAAPSRPRPGERVLDLCAAPGGKTTHLAALMEDRGAIVAVERHAGRAEALARTSARMGASSVEVRTGDAIGPHEPGRLRPGARRPALLGPRHARVPARRALAQAGRPAGAARRAAGRDPARRRRTRCAPAGRSCTPPARSPRRRTRTWWIASWPSARTSPRTTSARRSGRSGSMDGGPCTSRRSPIETCTDGFFVARLRRAGAS